MILQVRSHLESAFPGAARRRDLERMHQARNVVFDVRFRPVFFGPPPDVGREAAGILRCGGRRFRFPGRRQGLDGRGWRRVRRCLPVAHGLHKPGVLAGDDLPAAFALDPGARVAAQALPQVRARQQQLQVLEDRVFLGVVHRNLQANVVRVLGKGADVGDQDGAAEAERAQQGPRRFAHRGIAQVQNDIGGGDRAHKIADTGKTGHPYARTDAE